MGELKFFLGLLNRQTV